MQRSAALPAATPFEVAAMDKYTRLTNLEVTGKLKVGGGVSAPDAEAAAGSAPTKAEFDAVVTLVNELKAKLTGK